MNPPTREECTSKTDETHKTRSVHLTAAFKLENRSVEPCRFNSLNPEQPLFCKEIDTKTAGQPDEAFFQCSVRAQSASNPPGGL